MESPNLLIFLTDQQRFDCIGRAGKFGIKTPNIDRLCDEGTWFTHAFTPTPVCAPAKQAIMSGVQSDSLGILWNFGTAGMKSLSPGGDFWTKALKRRGYTNAYFGEWHVSENGEPADFGFDSYVSLSDYKKFFLEKYTDIECKNGWFGEPSPIDYKDALPHWLASKINDFIKTEGNEPWLSWFVLPNPHLPCRPSEPFASMYRPEDMKPWDSFGDTLEHKPYIQKRQLFSWGLEGMTWEKFAPTVAYYFGMITQIDDALGTVLDTLENAGIIDNTVVVFISDHGDTCGGHGMLDKHYILYDDVTRVPFIVRYPKAFPKGFECGEFVSSCLDIAPTVEELCGLEPSGKHHGTSLLKTMAGLNPEKFSVSTSNGQQFGLFTQRCIRNESYKYIWNLTDIDEFYDLSVDPGEKTNRIDEPEYAETIGAMKKQLLGALKRRDDPFINGWTTKQLLG